MRPARRSSNVAADACRVPGGRKVVAPGTPARGARADRQQQRVVFERLALSRSRRPPRRGRDRLDGAELQESRATSSASSTQVVERDGAPVGAGHGGRGAVDGATGRASRSSRRRGRHRTPAGEERLRGGEPAATTRTCIGELGMTPWSASPGCGASARTACGAAGNYGRWRSAARSPQHLCGFLRTRRPVATRMLVQPTNAGPQERGRSSCHHSFKSLPSFRARHRLRGGRGLGARSPRSTRVDPRAHRPDRPRGRAGGRPVAGRIRRHVRR
jgi:hypothetical protein